MSKKQRTDKLIQGWFEPSKDDDGAVLLVAEKYFASGYTQKQIIAEGITALAEKYGIDIPLPQYGGINIQSIELAVSRGMSHERQELFDSIRRLVSSGALVAATPEIQRRIEEEDLTSLEESLGNEYRNLNFSDEDE